MREYNLQPQHTPVPETLLRQFLNCYGKCFFFSLNSGLVTVPEQGTTGLPEKRVCFKYAATLQPAGETMTKKPHDFYQVLCML